MVVFDSCMYAISGTNDCSWYRYLDTITGYCLRIGEVKVGHIGPRALLIFNSLLNAGCGNCYMFEVSPFHE